MIKNLLNSLICLSMAAGTCAQGVGIGTATPFARLQVSGYGAGSIPMLALQDSGNNTFPRIYLGNVHYPVNWDITGACTGGSAGDFLNIDYGGVPFSSTYFSINGYGQIGVGGTTTQNNWLQVGNVPGIFSGNGLAIGNGNQAMSFAQYAGTSTWYSNTGFSIMPNTGNGFVGIGTQAPTAALHVYSPSTGTTPNILAEQSNADFARILFRNNKGDAFTLAAATGDGINVSDDFNIYSNTLGANLININTQSVDPAQPTGAINLNATTNVNQATVLKTGYAIVADGSVNNDWYLPNNTLISLGDNGISSSGIQITGFTPAVAGRIVMIYCNASAPITLKNSDARSLQGNRIITPGGGDITLHSGDLITLICVQVGWAVASKNF